MDIWCALGAMLITLARSKQVEAYARATKLDPFHAVAYFQMGVSNFLLEKFAEAMANFDNALQCMRGNILIDYEQLGLKFQLYTCEVLFNRGLSMGHDQGRGLGMQDMDSEDRQVVDEAISDKVVVCLSKLGARPRERD